MSDPRAEAARALAAVLEEGQSLEVALPRADARLDDPRDRALVRAIVFATLRGVWRHRARLARLLDKPLKRRDRLAEAVLLTGLAQLDAGIAPPYAAVSGTVAAARTLGLAQLAGLVNAVLRRHLRDAPLAADDDETVHDHPQWLIDRLRADWPDRWKEVLDANNAPAPQWLRVNRRRTTRDAYRAALGTAGRSALAHDGLPDALRIDDPLDVASLPGFAEGHASVQDGSAQLAVELVAPRAGLRVLDACAAPGGKAAHLLERAPDAAVVALDRKAARVRRLEEGLARLGLAADVRVGDASATDWWDGVPFDRILLDAPCSGTGVIRRHPDIRVLRRAGDVAAQVAAQRRLLDALWPMLVPGGRLVYATCSVLQDENARQLESFLERTPDAAPRADAVPAWFGVASGPGRQNLPGDDGMDGFYYGVVEKRA